MNDPEAAAANTREGDEHPTETPTQLRPRQPEDGALEDQQDGNCSDSSSSSGWEMGSVMNVSCLESGASACHHPSSVEALILTHSYMHA